MSARGVWLCALLLLLPTRASAQRVDLGTVTVEVAPPARLDDFVIAPRVEVPRVGHAEAPMSAWTALDTYADAHDRLARTLAELRAASTPSSDGHRSSAYDVERARAARDEASDAAAGSALSDALAAQEATLSRSALLVLGMLRYRAAQSRYEVALDAEEACLARSTSCAHAELDDASAVATWARVAGGDVPAAWSLYERALSLAHHGAGADARHALEEALAIPHLPPRLEASAAFLLGEWRERDAEGSPTEAFARCAPLVPEPLAPHCALRAGALLDDDGAALAVLAPWLDDAEIGGGARRLTREIFARIEPLPVLDGIAPATRARVLAVGAEQLAADGRYARAQAAIEEARSLAPSAALDALGASITAEHTTDSPEAWLRRTVLFCARTERTPLPGRWELRGRLGPRGAGITLTRPPPAPDLAALSSCLMRAPLAPESPLEGSFRATLVLEARVAPVLPHLRRASW